MDVTVIDFHFVEIQQNLIKRNGGCVSLDLGGSTGRSKQAWFMGIRHEGRFRPIKDRPPTPSTAGIHAWWTRRDIASLLAAQESDVFSTDGKMDPTDQREPEGVFVGVMGCRDLRGPLPANAILGCGDHSGVNLDDEVAACRFGMATLRRLESLSEEDSLEQATLAATYVDGSDKVYGGAPYPGGTIMGADSIRSATPPKSGTNRR